MRNETLRNAKAELRKWFASQDSAYLTRVIDECRAGTFGFIDSCHCIVGLLPDKPHYGFYSDWKRQHGYAGNEVCPAELGLMRVGFMADGGESAQELRRRNFTLPLVLAEIRRRTKAAQHDRVEVVKGF